MPLVMVIYKMKRLWHGSVAFQETHSLHTCHHEVMHLMVPSLTRFWYSVGERAVH